MSTDQPTKEPAQWIASPRAIAIWNRASAAYNRKVTDKLWSEAAALEIDEALKEIDDEHARRHAPASVDGEVMGLLEELLNNTDEPPPANCSCHIAPPCNDCVDNSSARELRDRIRTTLAKLRGADVSPDAQRVAIAEACGWQKIQRPLSDQEGEIPGHFEIRWYHPKIHTSVYPLYALPKEPPAYLTDLNAMHEAEQHAFVATSQWAKYGNQLQEVCHWHAVGIVPDYPRDLASLARVAHATAAQRAEAFLRCLGKWKE